MVLRIPRLPALAIALLILAGCTAPSGAGNLQISLSGLPAGQTAAVAVTGPGSYGATLSGTTTLSDLVPGSYAVQAGSVTVAAVSSEFVATVTPPVVAVAAGSTAIVVVAYAPRGGTLAVTIEGLPPTVDADVTVNGPDGFVRDLTASETLLDVPPGVYSMTATGLEIGSNRYVASASGSPAEVSSNSGAAIGVAYALVPGSLELTISGLPPGLDADLLVTGPDGSSQVVTQDVTLVDLTPGLYALTLRAARSDHPTVSDIYDPVAAATTVVEVASDATVVAGLSYRLRSGSGALWTPHNATTSAVVTGYAASSLSANGAQPPDVTLSGAVEHFQGIAFDGAGNLWTTNISNDTVVRFRPTDLAGDGSPTADVVLAGCAQPTGLAFDGAGHLWISNRGADTLVRLGPEQLTASGSPLPEAIIGASGGSLDNPGGIAFDSDGSLWVANFSAANSVVKFGPAQLSASGNPVPEVTLSDAGSGRLVAPGALAFDGDGDLWVASFQAVSTLLKYADPDTLSGPVAPVPSVDLDSPDIGDLGGLAFDASGNLWVSEFPSGNLFMFAAPGSLAGAVTPAAAPIITGTEAIGFGLLAFAPPPEGLPIRTP